MRSQQATQLQTKVEVMYKQVGIALLTQVTDDSSSREVLISIVK